MMWVEIAAIVVLGILVFKFIFKPIFKIIGIGILVFLAWWFINHPF